MPTLEQIEKERVESKRISVKAEEDRLVEVVNKAVINALQRGAADNKYIDVGRIPFICDDIRGIHILMEGREKQIDRIISDLWWMKYLGAGFLAAAGLLALKALGA